MTTKTDIIVFGATSFVGQILARYLLERHGASGDGPEQLTWALAGRNAKKLDELRAELTKLDQAASELPMIVADAGDEAALRTMVEQGSVIVSTVGPYALFGETLVRVCAEMGTDYCDLTGEVQWVKAMIERYQDVAVKSGARLITSSGFDSIPSDLGVFVLQQAATERFGVPAQRVRTVVKAMKGGISGGTAASLMNIASKAAKDKELRRVLADPYAIVPSGDRPSVKQPDVQGPQHDDVTGRWVGPFVMAGINTRVVHRTNALTGHSYGEDFQYDEAMATGAGMRGRVQATALTAALAIGMGAAALPITGSLVKRVLPDPGEGPSPKQQHEGFFDFRLHGTTGTDQRIELKVTGDRDPGYGSTGKMLGEVAACLARDVPARTDAAAGGFWTPASLLGDDLVQRLTAHAGLTFDIA